MNHGDFRDGDQNTALLDLDGSLSGFVVVDKTGRLATNAYPISLNNLPFNHAFNSVDECLAEGGQNKKFEGRPTALMSPGSVGSLGFEAMFPNEITRPTATTRSCVFSKDSMDFVGTDLAGALGDGAPWPGRPGNLGAEGDERIRLHRERGSRHPEGRHGDARRRGEAGHRPAEPPNTFYVRMGMCYTSEDKSGTPGTRRARTSSPSAAATGRTGAAASRISRTPRSTCTGTGSTSGT